jgi:hypothetical protein
MHGLTLCGIFFFFSHEGSELLQNCAIRVRPVIPQVVSQIKAALTLHLSVDNSSHQSPVTNRIHDLILGGLPARDG